MEFTTRVLYQVGYCHRLSYCHKKADWSTIREKFGHFKTTFMESCHLHSVEENWKSFKTTVLNLMDLHIPSRMTKSRQNLPWWNRSLHRLVRKKQRAYKKASKSHSPSAWSKYRSIQKQCQASLRRARWDYVNNILLQGLENDNTKPFWRYVKSRRQDSVGVAPLRVSGKLHSDSKEKANILNDQFKSVFTPESDAPLPDLDYPQQEDISQLTINTAGVEKLLGKLKVNKAAGPDDIPCIILKELAAEIAPVLTSIYN